MQDSAAGEELYHGKLINLRVQTLAKPTGGTTRYEIVEHPDAVAIVALRYDTAGDPHTEPGVMLVSQERPAIGKQTWEIPAGIVEPDERNTPQLAAARELYEETGYLADSWQYLIREYTSPGFSTEAITIYLATRLHPASATSAVDTPADPTEIAQVRWMPLSEALALCQNGEIEDGKTLLGLYLVQNMLMADATAIGTYPPGQRRSSAASAARSGQAKGEGGQTMPHDLTNMPFPRAAPYRSSATTRPETDSGDRLNGTLNIESMLLEEFNYASLTAYQAMEDRARISSLYYLLLGALASGLLALYQAGGSAHTYSQSLVIALLVTAGILSITFFEKIIRLRLAYRESLICMNVIKEFYIQQFQQQMPYIEHAFRWRLKTIPPGESIKSVTFAISALIALMGSLCFAAAVLVGIAPGVIANPGVAGPGPYVISMLVLLVVLVSYVSYYRYSLSGRKGKKVLEEQAEEMGISLPL